MNPDTVYIDPAGTSLNSTLVANDTKIGWVSQSNQRGTFDIIQNCIFTIFLCTWTSVHLNVPSPIETYWQKLNRKIRWMVQALLGPEFVLAFAVGQREDAKLCVKAFEDFRLLPGAWTLRHAFFANMGGFHLQPRGSDPFPINGKHLHYLITKRYLEVPKITEEDIKDKSKADGIAKVLVCFQTLWFVIQCIARAIQQLPITTLELTTIGFVLCTTGTYFHWLRKPLDIEIPVVLHTDKTVEEILREAGPAGEKRWHQSPLEFVDNLNPCWILNVQPYLRFKTGPKERPWTRFPNDRFPVIGAGLDSILLYIITFLYCSIHAIGWHFSFPTRVELILWRVCAMVVVGTTFIFLMCETYQDGHRLGRWKRWRQHILPKKSSVVRSNEPKQQGVKIEEMFVPTWEIIIMTPVGIIYGLARAYVLVEVFVGLRLLPAKTYVNVEWTDFLPHF